MPAPADQPEKPSPTLSREVITTLSKKAALDLIRATYAADPRPFFQAFAKDKESLESVYYGILMRED